MRDLDSLLDGASAVMPVTIFDRNHGTTRANHLFPEKFSEYIAGTLHPSQIDIAYKGYRFSLNLNSVKNSQTMFARRAYELLACGTVTISNYARGLKVMLGDLVPMTDSAHQTSQILAALREDVDAYDRLRLAGIRKVHHEHTFEERLRYLSSRISGTEYHFNRKKITVLSPVSSLGEAEHVVATVHRQQGVDPQLVLVSDSREVSELARDQGFGFVAIDSSDTISHVADPEAFAWTVMHPSDWHGDHYLLDLALAGGYCEAQVIGRRHVAEYSSDISWNGSKGAYRSTEGLTPRQAIVRLGALDAPTISEALHADESLLQPSTQFTIDRFDYCLNGANAAQSILDLVSSDLDIDQGCDVSAVLAGVEAVPIPALDRTVISPKVYHSKLIRTKGINTARVEGGVRVASALEPGTGKSRWTKTRIPLQDVLKDGLLNISLDTSQAAIVRPTVRYFDADGNNLKSPIYPANALTTVKPPEGSVSCEFGLRFNNSGTAIIHAWNLSPDRITAYTPNSTRRVLIVSTHYPTYEHPYRFGFLHSRLRNYAQHGLTPDVFLLNPSETAGFAEYDGIETRTGGAADLAAQIASGVYDTIAVHFLDARIWNVIKPFKETHRVRVWIHGSDIQPWWRRAFNYETPEKLEAAKPASDKRLALWREVFDNPPADFAVVAVSQQFIDEAQVDIERTIPPSDVHVVHNPIDTDLFTYVEKPESQRLKILSIRPYASRTYANDLAVAAVLELSSEPWFDQLEFVFIGDGHLFESTTEPIRDLPNVTLRQGFLTQHEIADLHKEFGVFLVPTRMDSQGVSRDEAMSSGLVAITNDVAAVPEFVSSAEGYLAPDEDSAGLAAAIRDLYAHPDVFLEKSQAAAARVRAQSASSIVIPQEIALLGGVERKHRNSLVD
ncbi:MAG: glycosyltransferase [Actinomycetales bacterium]|nr:glycosyltransferase [Actinomycetales bacterium]